MLRSDKKASVASALLSLIQQREKVRRMEDSSLVQVLKKITEQVHKDICTYVSTTASKISFFCFCFYFCLVVSWLSFESCNLQSGHYFFH